MKDYKYQCSNNTGFHPVPNMVIANILLFKSYGSANIMDLKVLDSCYQYSKSSGTGLNSSGCPLPICPVKSNLRFDF